MSLTAALEKRAIEDSEEIRPKGPYLRLRIQPRRRVSARIVAMCMIAASLLFIKVWERTVANSLSMERDRIAREVRFVENRIRITRDLEEQQALRSGLDLTSLSELGFQAPDPARVVDEATYERPAQFSQGIVHVLVNGVFVVRNGASVAGSPFPGRAIRRGS